MRQIFDDINAMQSLIDSLPIAIFVKDATSKFLLMNKACEAQWGMSFSDLIGTDASHVFPSDQMEWFLAKDKEVFSGRRKVEFEETFWNAQLKQNRIGHTIKTPIYDAENTPLYLICVTIDITDSKNSTQALIQSEEKLRSMFQMSPLGMARNAMDGTFLEANDSFLNIVGYSLQELNRLSYWDLTPESYADQEAQQLESLKNQSRYGPYEKEYINRLGERVPVRLNGIQISGRDGEKFIWSFVEDISERKKSEEKINKLAFFDQLTELPNRTLMLDRLNQVMTAGARNGKYASLMLIDLDNFKTLNDTLGHAMGDLLLKQVGERLTTCVRLGDTVARLGGDEFVIILSDLSTNIEEAASQTEIIGRKILASLNQRYLLNEVIYLCTPSVGATLFRGHLSSMDDLMKQADLAMYKSKADGRNALRFFDLKMETAVTERAALEGDLREAINQNQFLLYYQAQVIENTQVVGAEVLIRWNHPRRGMVPPIKFIPLAEESGMILALGQWVLETACAQLIAWETIPEMSHLTVAVNVSAYQIRQPDFVDQVIEVLNNSGANPRRLKLELTESILVSNIEDIIQKMSELKKIGVGFSLDDFGTGYSSLSYLKRLPLDQLKIDQSFVRDVLTDPNDASIAKTIIALAHSLDLEVIAEGVETDAQREFLANSGCKAYQGYFFSKPLPVKDFEIYVRRI